MMQIQVEKTKKGQPNSLELGFQDGKTIKIEESAVFYSVKEDSIFEVTIDQMYKLLHVAPHAATTLFSTISNGEEIGETDAIVYLGQWE